MTYKFMTNDDTTGWTCDTDNLFKAVREFSCGECEECFFDEYEVEIADSTSEQRKEWLYDQLHWNMAVREEFPGMEEEECGGTVVCEIYEDGRLCFSSDQQIMGPAMLKDAINKMDI